MTTLFLGSLLLPIVAVSFQAEPAKPRVSFLREIAPIFKANCLGCHGQKSPAAGLNFTSNADIAKVVKAGDPEASVLIHSLRGVKGRNIMPKGFPALAPDTIALVSRWIQEGAHFTEPVDFKTDIEPILKSACLSCHGEHPKAGLDLRDSKQLLAHVAPGDAEKSELYRRIMGYDGKPQMPKGFPALRAEQIAVIKKWINEGASLASQGGVKPKHWAYVPLKTPLIPKDTTNAIDYFVSQKLAGTGLKPNPQADKYTLLRRVSLDLIGLPPTPAEIDDFLKDTAPNAYEKVVDRLLKNPQYGVRQARPWLDLARFADSNGFEKDGSRVLWPWRDWVINAFNANMPYDQFTTEQLAGDLLKNPTQDQLIATGFNRNTMHNFEDGVDEGEALHNIIIDRVNTTATAFMGSTLACSRCHDHKFDPLTQKDYFSMLAYFNNPKLTKTGADFYQNWYEDEIIVWKPGQREALDQLRQERKAANTPADQKALDAKIAAAESQLVRTLVMRDDPAVAIPRTFIKHRGEYLSNTTAVLPQTPAAFGPTPAALPLNRLGLAKWLSGPQNPMMPRVQVNRVWEQVFGRGLVETSEDFGTRASEPSHPELLEWLASSFVKRGWDQKWLMKTLVMSKAYRQSSVISAAALQADPNNILLARGPRFRMEAEMIRDSSLFGAGLLSLKIGGPSVMPHQPEGVWNTPYSGEYWIQSTGADLYRRGIYTFAKRTAPYPNFTAFDAPSREECTVRRIRTNTPMQALALMNDPVMVEASRSLGARMAKTAGSTEHKIGTGILWVLSRPARPAEVASLQKLLKDQTQHYESQRDQAAKIAGDPKLAPWVIVANVILTLDEAITKP